MIRKIHNRAVLGKHPRHMETALLRPRRPKATMEREGVATQPQMLNAGPLSAKMREEKRIVLG